MKTERLWNQKKKKEKKEFVKWWVVWPCTLPVFFLPTQIRRSLPSFPTFVDGEWSSWFKLLTICFAFTYIFFFFLHNRVPFHLSGEVLGPCDPEDLIDGIIFAATYLGCTHLLSERTPSKSARMQQAQEAMSRVRVSDVMHKWHEFRSFGHSNTNIICRLLIHPDSSQWIQVTIISRLLSATEFRPP